MGTLLGSMRCPGGRLASLWTYTPPRCAIGVVESALALLNDTVPGPLAVIEEEHKRKLRWRVREDGSIVAELVNEVR